MNKIQVRNALNLNETLSSLLTIKMAINETCFKFEPPQDVVEKSKTVTWEYNKVHSKE
jgi:hypothetical protein